jgi:hypothetical protein
LTDPLGLWTLSLGYYGSSVAGVGGSVGAGVYVSYANGQLAYGSYVNGAVEAGVNVGAGIQAGFYTGDTNTFGGRTNEVNVGTELGGLTGVYSTSGDLVGGAISLGPSLTPISYSAGGSVTGLIGGTNASSQTSSVTPQSCPK